MGKRISYEEVDDLAGLEASLKVKDQYRKKGILVDLFPSEGDPKDISLERAKDLIAQNSGTSEYINKAADILYPSIQRKSDLVVQQNAKPSKKIVTHVYKNSLTRVFAEFPKIRFEEPYVVELRAVKDCEKEIEVPKSSRSYFTELVKTRQRPEKIVRSTKQFKDILAEWKISEQFETIDITFYDPIFLSICSNQLLDLESMLEKFYTFHKIYDFPIED